MTMTTTRMKRGGGLIPLVLGMAFLAGCDADTVGPQTPVVAAVEVSPSSRTMTVGDTLRLTAVAKAGDGTEITGRSATWASLDGTYARVEGAGSTALVTARSPGSASITATVDGKVGTTTLTVVAAAPVPAYIELSFGKGWLEVGEEAHLNATVRTADGSVMDATGLVWETDAAEVAGVTPLEQPRLAKITARSEGTTLITARLGEIRSSATVNVLPASEPAGSMGVSPATLTVERGAAVQLQAWVSALDGAWIPDPVVHWVSSDTAVATVTRGANRGRATLVARATGVITVRAMSGGRADSAQITVVAPMNVGEVVITSGDRSIWKTQFSTLQAVVRSPTGATLGGAPVIWSVEDSTVAEIDAVGQVRGLRPGSTRVFAESGGVKGEATLTVHEWPTDGALELTLAHDVDPNGGRRDVAVTGTTVWTDSTGVEYPAFLWLKGGSITFHGNGSYTQRFHLDVVISGFGGIMQRVEQRVSETSGQVGYDIFDSFAFFLHPADGGPVLRMKPREAGAWVIDQKVGSAPLLSWLWTME